MAEVDTAEILREVVERESQFKTTAVNKPIDVDLDIGSLLAVDTNPINEKKLRAKNISAYIDDLNRDNVQLLLNQIWELPTERVEDAIVAKLPEPTTQCPREKSLPKPRQETKWEAYAKLKGIQNKKKDRLVWDKVHQEYRPSFGYKRANDETKDWLIEVPETADPMEDQYAKRKDAKKERIAKNEYQRLRNIAKTTKGGVPATNLKPVEKPSRDQMNLALSVAKTSTASAGKFTKALPKEHEVKKPRGKKRKFESNSGSIANEKERQLNVLKTLGNKKEKLNTAVAVKKNRQEDEQSRRDANLAKPPNKKMARKQAAILSGKKGKPGGKKRGKK